MENIESVKKAFNGIELKYAQSKYLLELRLLENICKDLKNSYSYNIDHKINNIVMLEINKDDNIKVSIKKITNKKLIIEVLLCSTKTKFVKISAECKTSEEIHNAINSMLYIHSKVF